MNATPVHVVTLAEIVPKHEAEVLDTLKQLVELTRQEEGCIRYDLYREAANPMRINTIELWSDEASLNRHMSAPHLKNAIMSLIGKLSGIPQFRVLSPIDELDV